MNTADSPQRSSRHFASFHPGRPVRRRRERQARRRRECQARHRRRERQTHRHRAHLCNHHQLRRRRRRPARDQVRYRARPHHRREDDRHGRGATRDQDQGRRPRNERDLWSARRLSYGRRQALNRLVLSEAFEQSPHPTERDCVRYHASFVALHCGLEVMRSSELWRHGG
jgi:hypothetical protein